MGAQPQTKKRVQVAKPGDGLAVAGFMGAANSGADSLKVVDEQPGTVGWLDKAKGYYHTLISGIGALLMAINELTPAAEALLPAESKHYITLTIGALTTVANFLKHNEQWVDDL